MLAISKSTSEVFRIVVVVILVFIVVLQIFTLTQIPTSRESPPSGFIKALWVLTQIGILFVLLLTLIPIRNNYAAQLLRDRYDMFFKSWEVSPDDVSLLMRKEKSHLLVENEYMEKNYLAKLQSDAKAAEDYLLIVQLYEYLAFAHALTFSTKYLGRWCIGKSWERSPTNRINDNYFDPYGEQWIKRWVEILVEDPDFPHVHLSYEKDHPQFYRFVKDFVKAKYPDFYNNFVKDRVKPEGKETSIDPIVK